MPGTAVHGGWKLVPLSHPLHACTTPQQHQHHGRPNT
jgi:hypothetical protein